MERNVCYFPSCFANPPTSRVPAERAIVFATLKPLRSRVSTITLRCFKLAKPFYVARVFYHPVASKLLRCSGRYGRREIKQLRDHPRRRGSFAIERFTEAGYIEREGEGERWSQLLIDISQACSVAGGSVKVHGIVVDFAESLRVTVLRRG